MPNHPQVILITGLATTFTGPRLLVKLLERYPEAHFLCVASEDMLPRAEGILTAFSGSAPHRVEILKADTTAMDFGLSGKGFLHLASQVELIHHCDAISSLGADRTLAEQRNITGIGEVLELAMAASRLKQLVFWSTASVSGSRSGTVMEDELIKPSHFRNLIEETRFRAEKLVRDQMGRLPITVLRPSTIVGDTQTGEIDRLEGVYLLIKFILNMPLEFTLPLPQKGEVFVNQVPICYLVDTAMAICSSPKSIGRTFHIVDPQPITVGNLCENIAAKTKRSLNITDLPTGLATYLLRIPGLKQISDIPRTYLEQLSIQVTYDQHNTSELLKGTGLTCPAVTSYLDTQINFVRRQMSETSVDKFRKDPLD